MLTVIVNGKVYRQTPAVMHNRTSWLRFAREDPRDVQVWETGTRVSVRLN